MRAGQARAPAARRGMAALAAAIAALTGCSAAPHPAAGPAAGQAAATRAAGVPPPAVPTLGQPAGVFARGKGFGQVKPATVFNGGDPTGLVTHIAWRSWGGSRAIGTGTTDYVGPSQSVATGTAEPATIVAFNLGSYDGKLMYHAVEWYFPQHGQAFDPGRYEDICTGSYVPGP